MAYLAAPLVDAGAWLFAQTAAPRRRGGRPAGGRSAAGDTLIVRQAPIDPGWFERLGETLRALMTLAILVLTVAVVPAAWNFRKSYKKVSDLLDRVYADVNPITHHASRIAENVDYVTTAVRADAERARARWWPTPSERVRLALERAEARARDLEALLDVAQGEAERSLVTAASTVAGVREGVAALRSDLVAAARDGSPRRGGRTAGRLRRARRTTRRTTTIDGADAALADDLALVDVRADERPRVRRRPD
jgi:hypothetical protein